VDEAEVACGRGGFTLCRPSVCESVSSANKQRPGGGAGDAEAAARALLAGETAGESKDADGAAESLRSVRVARRSAVKARTQAANQLHALLSTAPERLKEGLRGLPTRQLAVRAALPVRREIERPRGGDRVRHALRRPKASRAFRGDRRTRRPHRGAR
jgi:hypothetical protein